MCVGSCSGPRTRYDTRYSRDEVQHDRADHFEHVKAQCAAPPRCQPTARRRSTPRRERAGQRAAARARRTRSATAVAAAAPTRNCPSAPMLKTPARNAMCDREPGEDQRRRAHQRARAERVPRSERSANSAAARAHVEAVAASSATMPSTSATIERDRDGAADSFHAGATASKRTSWRIAAMPTPDRCASTGNTHFQPTTATSGGMS